MGKGREKRRCEAVTPEQLQDKFSPSGLDFEESLRPVLGGGPDDEHRQGEKDVNEHSDAAEPEPTDEELIAVWESTIAGVRDGTLPTFRDAASLREDIRKRFNR